MQALLGRLGLSKPWRNIAVCQYLFQNELPNQSLKSNKLDGSFFFYPRMNVSSFSLLVLLYLSYVNLFKELFLLTFFFRTYLVLLEVSFVLESGCKGSTFSVISKTFLHKMLIFRRILTVIHINAMFYCVRAQSRHTIGLYSINLTKCQYFPYFIKQNA